MKYTTANMRMWSRLGPSGSLGTAAMEIGSQFENAVFLTSDMTFAAGLERFRNRFPDRIYNVGIAEQSLVCTASGLASEGYTPFAVTYATFLAARALDQIKLNLGYMRQPVKLVGLNGGFAAGILGPTHMALEDLAAMRSIPNLTIIAPADMTEVVKALLSAAEYDGPVYIRLTGEMNQPQVYTEDYDFQIGKSVVLREGEDVSILACGTVIYNCCQAAERLEKQGVSVRVVNMHTVKPLDTDILDAILTSKLVVTVEEHNVLGGLGSAVSEYLAGKRSAPRVCRIGVQDRYPHAGSYCFLLRKCGLDADSLETAILKCYREDGS